MAAAGELTEMGGIEGFDPQASYETTQEVWQSLSDARPAAATQYIFSGEDFYLYDQMEESELDAMLAAENLDLMMVFGTAAGKYLTDHADVISYDYMVFGATDPISSGIVKSIEERYNDHAYAQIDPKRITRQIEGAYELFAFRDIGVVYENADAAYSYSGIGQLVDASEKYGFTIHVRHVAESAGADDDERYYRELKAAYDDLQDEIDALYITTATIDDAMLPGLLSDLHAAGVATIAESSESQVACGAMMHISLADAQEEGQFFGHILSEYAAGTPITELSQLFEISPKIYFNRETLAQTNRTLPLEIFLVADHIYPDADTVSSEAEENE